MKSKGRPTEAKKDIMLKVRIDEQTNRMLDYCTRMSGSSKSEVIRSGIELQYKNVKGEKEK